MAELFDLDIAEASRRIAARSLSAVELSEAYLNRIEKVDSDLSAFLAIDPDDVRKAAHARQISIDRDGPVSRLDGIPLAIKDVIDIAGQRTSAHSAITIGHVATADAAVVDHLRQNGAIMLGKTALHEFAIGGPAFDLPWPPARNPWNRAHHPGGSSSGSAAAVAARMAPAALGTDTAGSVRNPATCCGLYGLKPTAGAVSRRGVFPLAFTLDAVGPLTRSVEDMALLFAAIAQPDSHESGSHVHPYHARLQHYDTGIAGWRLGIVRFHRNEPATESAVAENFETVVRQFEALGAQIVEIDLPALSDWSACGRTIQQSEAYSVHRPWLEVTPEQYCSSSRQKLLAGAFVRAVDYVDAMKARRILSARVDAAFQDCDALLCVSSMTTPCQIEDEAAIKATYEKHARLPFNISGHPALAFPTGFSPSGLPIGHQLVAPFWREDLLFQIADAYQAEYPWHLEKPSV